MGRTLITLIVLVLSIAFVILAILFARKQDDFKYTDDAFEGQDIAEPKEEPEVPSTPVFYFPKGSKEEGFCPELIVEELEGNSNNGMSPIEDHPVVAHHQLSEIFSSSKVGKLYVFTTQRLNDEVIKEYVKLAGTTKSNVKDIFSVYRKEDGRIYVDINASNGSARVYYNDIWSPLDLSKENSRVIVIIGETTLEIGNHIFVFKLGL